MLNASLCFYFIRQLSLFPSIHWTLTINMWSNGKNIIRYVSIIWLIVFEFVFSHFLHHNTSTYTAYFYFIFLAATHPTQKWETDAQSKEINSHEVTRTGNCKIQTNIEGLNPGATYTVRLRVLAESPSEAGKASPELIIDTEAVSCTPKPSCVILWCVSDTPCVVVLLFVFVSKSYV